MLIGIAQERADVFRAPAVRDREPGRYAVRRLSAYVNHLYLYLYLWDRDMGGAFIKVCTYGPWSVRVWSNGHSWARRRLEDRHLGYQPLDNGFAAVDDGRVLQEACEGLSAAAIERFVRRWLARLPSPFTEADIDAGYRYELSILQLEVSCTEVFDRPLHGRQSFEQVITDQLDLGRPEKLQPLFEHRILRDRRAPFRTRVFGAGAQPSLQVEHRRTKIKQYWKLERARLQPGVTESVDMPDGRNRLGARIRRVTRRGRRPVVSEGVCTESGTDRLSVSSCYVLPLKEPLRQGAVSLSGRRQACVRCHRRRVRGPLPGTMRANEPRSEPEMRERADSDVRGGAPGHVARGARRRRGADAI